MLPMDNEPAQTDMSVDDYNRHMLQTVTIEVHRPRLNLSQGSFLRCSRSNASTTIRALIQVTGGDTYLTIKDSVTAAQCRKLTPELRALLEEREQRSATMEVR